MNMKKIIKEEIEDFNWIKDENLVDLRTAKFGDILVSSHGAYLMYIGELPEEDYYDHEVVFLKIPERNVDGQHFSEVTNLEPLSWGGRPERFKYKYGGTRVHSGHSFKKNRLPDYDHDIIEIIPREQFDETILRKGID
jgi:hypothetical protein